jgi:FlaA1/EpsC-like NDP-sugar epimerase
MSYSKRVPILIAVDFAIVWASLFVVYVLSDAATAHFGDMRQFMLYSILAAITTVSCLYAFKLYNRIWQYASVGELLSILKAVFVSGTMSYLAAYVALERAVSISLHLLGFETILLLIGGSRFVWRVVRSSVFRKTRVRQRQTRKRRNALIVGAGDCGTMIAKELMYNPTSQMWPVAFIDDDVFKHKLQVLGLPVYGGRDRIPEAVELFQADDIVIAMPSVSKKEISKLIDICKLTKARLKIVPKIGDLIDGNVTIRQMRDVDVEDLLGRDPIRIDLDGVADYVENKTVLVTGAGGSIGSELCRQIASFRPKQLLLLGHGENSIYAIEDELKRAFPGLRLEPLIADIQDRSRIDAVFREFRPHVVFHAAAHKHVPLMERNPQEAVKNNVFGTKNVADAADRYGTERFVLISTDKAVNPTSVMGATKRIAEMYIQSLNPTSSTVFAAVRFGNVLGSRGSVIPRFKEQIARGGPVTVTHPDMIRYFMTIPEAVQLVIQAGALAKGGEVFVLDMGEPVKILDLAKDLIRLSGFEPFVDIDIQYTGIRPGEKLYEELLTSEEGLTATKHDRIFVGRSMMINRNELVRDIERLENILNTSNENIVRCLQNVVPTYRNGDSANRKKLELVVQN